MVRKYNNEKRIAAAKERQHMQDLRMTLIDIAKFEIVELRKQLKGLQSIDDATNDIRKSINDAIVGHKSDIMRLHRPKEKKEGKKRLSEIEITRRQLLEAERQEKIAQRKLNRESVPLNEYKQRRRIAKLPTPRVCPRCNKTKLKSAQWCIKSETAICKSCWTLIQKCCKVFAIDPNHFLIEYWPELLCGIFN